MAGESDRSSTAQAGFGAIGAMAHDAIRAQQRTLELTQGWSASILSTLKEQAETNTTILRSVEASMVAMEEAATSQAQATKALVESLAASRQILESAMGAQTQAAGQVETFVAGLLQVLTGQLEALRSQLQLSQEAVIDPFAAQRDVWVQMSHDWMKAYNGPARRSRRLLRAPRRHLIGVDPLDE